MKRVPFTNTGNCRLTVGGLACRPGETVYIDERDHPDYRGQPAPAEEAPQATPVDQLLESKKDEAIAALAALDEDQLREVIEREKRVTVTAAANELLLERAKEEGDNGGQSGDDDKGDNAGQSGDDDKGGEAATNE
jgi:hypothetical protein